MSVHIRAEMPKDMLLTVTMPHVAEAIDENHQAFMKMFERYSIRSSWEHNMALNLMKDLFRKMFARMHKPRISMDLDDISLSQLVIMGQQFASNSIDKSAPQLTHSPPLVATVPLETIDAKQSRIALMAEGYPIEPFDTTWMTLDTVWREWHEGLGTGEWKRDSIEAL